ncbi:MAG: lipoate--protein ligase family protein [Spirochaetes bacterium]|nr:lipoate--protein ligase family protein [Spirochaetota bacterium]
MHKKNIYKLRFIDTDINDGYFNMALDEVLSYKVFKKLSIPILRFYRWNPPCLSIGYFQDANKEVNFDSLQKNKIDLVRRITGGRAVLHDIELTYTIIIPLEYDWIPSSINESYKILSNALLQGLKNLGINANISKPINGKIPHTTSACFDAPSSYELLANNKKIIGSAQKRFNGLLLQHGSIPIILNIDKLFDLLNIEPIEKREQLKNIFKNKATSISEQLCYIPEIKKVKEAFYNGFKEALPIELIDDKLTDEEKKETYFLIEKKYKTTEWNLNKENNLKYFYN